MTIVGTRPEIIRLSRIIPKLDEHCDHVLIHTGQNYDFELNEIFFSLLIITLELLCLVFNNSYASSVISFTNPSLNNFFISFIHKF